MRQAEGITCPFCGAPINAATGEATRCDYCGNEVRQTQQPPPTVPAPSSTTRSAQPSESAPPERSRRLVILISSIVLVVIGLGTAVAVRLSRARQGPTTSIAHCFDSEPEGAEVVYLGEVLGRTHLCVSSKLGKGQPFYEIRLEGFQPQEVALPWGKGGDVAVTLVRRGGQDEGDERPGVPVKVLWSKVQQAEGCDFFSSPETLGTEAYLEKLDNRVAVEFDARLQRFEAAQAGEQQLKLTRIERYNHLSGTYRVTETFILDAREGRLEGSYRYEECRLAEDEPCPGRCRLEAEVAISFL